MPSYLVTGANRGLGYGFVRQLTKDPANTVIGLVRDKVAADNTVAADGLKNVTMIQAEISNHKSSVAARDQVAQITGGSLDHLINNAAYIDGTTADAGLDDFEDTPETLETALLNSFQVNVVGVVHTINAFLPLIKKSTIKKVVLISSGMADPDVVNGGVWKSGPYTISKAAANMVVFKYNAKYKDDGILFFALSPGIVSTWGDKGEPKTVDDFRKKVPGWPGPLTPLESAEACLNVIHDFSVEKGNGGAFVSHHGTQQWL
ncbi:uncharacterized protein Z518_00582 [Rhinocladiella mackenziei CBS 650.93]|uniref:Uncharacterized protein n=1 Tax=Rhinocladiella mackenziei CBS 650.93 TaxID=1442369 RepID=A0A0D2G4D7_9EURO|nr:uncharacterized protein Z518_00582 [Rhinocladiella mackenziei CBS 650.93]KIX09502.1 hypothetical protein Z518_00582 [Rhinocladiella mackenziei CBS 650.93]